ncbi:3'-5' exonuclease [Aquimarina gracilis]|uniref:3'-5' exonuclease n=1 Tax=Aquimarina gracilis TaxID=874422 RepID=A0ABU5ZVL0_9FLAO|nr:3'-5' exonuclease [Aquimarina gracilis]MEB3345766.1 3'-5' exonuclease [Aquimarina gracilis]
MFVWQGNKNYPNFWKDYQNHFKDKKKYDLTNARFVILDTETTGLNIKNDRILSIGTISVTGNTMDVADSLELYLKQDTFNWETVKIHGILNEGNILKFQEHEALTLFLDHIKDAILVAHHAAFDIQMINACLARQKLPKLKNKVLDTGILFKKTDLCVNKDKLYSLDELCTIFNIKKHDRHTASGDAYITGIIFLKIIGQLSKTRKTTLKSLFFNPNRRGLL